jgi:glycosyltransferase involved in cell wall biosynthesis
MRKWLRRIDIVLAKTRLTERLFRNLGLPTKFIGFTSRDQFDGQVPRDYTKFLHASSSPCKGSKRLLEVWKAHPEWPELVVVDPNNDEVIASSGRPNIRIAKWMPNPEFWQLQNSIGFHMCCSEAEGFGHYIMESMGCGAVTFTTNGPPMNELVQPSRGILLDCLDKTSELGLSQRYFFKPESLEEQVSRVMKLDRPALDQIGSSARAFFLENDRLFRQDFPGVIRSLVESGTAHLPS